MTDEIVRQCQAYTHGPHPWGQTKLTLTLSSGLFSPDPRQEIYNCFNRPWQVYWSKVSLWNKSSFFQYFLVFSLQCKLEFQSCLSGKTISLKCDGLCPCLPGQELSKPPHKTEKAGESSSSLSTLMNWLVAFCLGSYFLSYWTHNIFGLRWDFLFFGLLHH